MGKKIISVDNETMKILLSHEWRGGVRELENVIERAVIFANKEIITKDNLADYLNISSVNNFYGDSLKDALRNFERDHITKTIKKYNYNKEEAAKALEIGLSSLYRKMDELNIPTKNIGDDNIN